MSLTKSHQPLTPPRLERLLVDLDRHFGQDGLTVYVTQSSLRQPLTLPPIAKDPSLDDLVEAAPAVAESETGAVFLWSKAVHAAVIPPFPVEEDSVYHGVVGEPLLELVQRPRWLGVVLLRLGRYAVGVLHGRRLVASKVGTRYVKGRHRAGGSSAPRFQRIREKQADELFKKTCEVARGVLEPHADRLEWLLYGGDRHVLRDFLKVCPYLGTTFEHRTLARLLSTREPRLAELERMPQEIYTSRVVTFGADVHH